MTTPAPHRTACRARADSVVVNPIATLGYEPVIGTVTTVEGFLNYYYGDYEIVQGLDVDEFSRARMDATDAELREERQAVENLL